MNNAAKIGIGLVVVAAAGIGYQIISANRVSDQVLIENALREAIVAGREGRAGSVLDLMSQSLTVNGREGWNRSDIGRAIRDYKPNVELTTTVAQVSGDAALITSPVKLSSGPPLNLGFTVPEATLEFAKEGSMKWLFIPERKWRLVKVTVPESALPEMGL